MAGRAFCLLDKQILVLEHRTQGGGVVVPPLRSPRFPFAAQTPAASPLWLSPPPPLGGSSNPLEHCPSVLIFLPRQSQLSMVAMPLFLQAKKQAIDSWLLRRGI